MDPNANLSEQLELARSIQRDFEQDKVSGYDANRLAELVLDLNTWIVKGGFLPFAWTVDGENKLRKNA